MTWAFGVTGTAFSGLIHAYTIQIIMFPRYVQGAKSWDYFNALFKPFLASAIAFSIPMIAFKYYPDGRFGSLVTILISGLIGTLFYALLCRLIMPVNFFDLMIRIGVKQK